MLLAIAHIVVPIVVIGATAVGGLIWYLSGDPGDKHLPSAPPPKGLPGNDGPNGNGPLKPGPEDDPVDARIAGVIGVYDDAAFHETQDGDSANEVVTKVLNKIDPGAGNNPQMIGALRKLINQSFWNRALYSESQGAGPHAFEGVHVVNFSLPKHENAIGVMKAGFFPKRQITAGGAPLPGSPRRWGDLWVPALNHQAVKDRVAAPAVLLAGPWPDGTPATEPPPDVFAALRDRDEAA